MTSQLAESQLAECLYVAVRNRVRVRVRVRDRFRDGVRDRMLGFGELGFGELGRSPVKQYNKQHKSQLMVTGQ